MIKAALFDLDGTLSDTITTIAYYGNLALNTYGFESIPTETYKKLVGNGRDKLIHRMLAYYNALGTAGCRKDDACTDSCRKDAGGLC